MNKIKPRFKRFEMHRNLPAALQHGTVVSASINKPRRLTDKPTRIESTRRSPKSASGERNDSKYPKMYEQ